MLDNTPLIYCAGIFDMKTYDPQKPDLSRNFQVFKLLLAEKYIDMNAVNKYDCNAVSLCTIVGKNTYIDYIRANNFANNLQELSNIDRYIDIQ